MRLLTALIFSVVFSPQAFSQWFQLSPGTSANLRSVSFFDPLTGFVTGAGGLIIKTTNGGVNWSVKPAGITEDINSVYFINTNTGYACANGGKIILTTNGGDNWSTIPTGVTDNLYSVHGSYCSGSGGTLLYTTNSGLNWQIGTSGSISTFYGIYSLSSTSAVGCGVNTIFQPLVARTTNGGANWSYSAFYLNGNEGNLRDLHFINGSSGFAVSNVWDGQGGVSVTVNGGVNWTTQLFTRALNTIDFAGLNYGYAAGLQGYIIRTTNSGISWSEQTSGVSGTLRGIDIVDSLTAYAVGDGGIILKTTNGGITALEPVSSELPLEFKLLQNYPNPFNPATKIMFNLPEGNFTLLKIYDALGSELEVLVNEYLAPGSYESSWDAGKYSSGIYYYRISAGDFTGTKKMILIK